MTIQEAIELAQKNGFGATDELIIEHGLVILLDPFFWQALSKALGWKDWAHYFNGRFVTCVWDWQEKQSPYGAGAAIVRTERYEVKPAWLHYQLQLIEHIADGGTIESYFEEL